MNRTESASQTLDAWTPTTPEMWELRREYVAFATDADRTHRETSGAQHLTVSAFVFSEDLSHLVLCFHRKGRFWVQLGGHIEPEDKSLDDAARREVSEESGLRGLRAVGDGPVDLDRHALGTGFGSCEVHWDVGYAFIADGAEQPQSSDESEDVAWWPVDALPAGSVAHLDERVGRVMQLLRAPRSGSRGCPSQ